MGWKNANRNLKANREDKDKDKNSHIFEPQTEAQRKGYKLAGRIPLYIILMAFGVFKFYVAYKILKYFGITDKIKNRFKNSLKSVKSKISRRWF